MPSGPLWLVLCSRPSCSCYVTGSNVDGARAQAARRCRHGRAPTDVRFAGYSQAPDLRATIRPKGQAKARRARRNFRLSELPGRARHLVECYLEARNGGSVRHAAAIRTLLADVGATLERIDLAEEDWARDLAAALDGDDEVGLTAALIFGLIMLDHGWTAEELFVHLDGCERGLVDQARRVECKVGW